MSAVIVSPYSAEWPALFRALRDEVLAAFAPMSIVVEHIGSTSVPELAAKPVIDMALGASSLGEIEAKIDALGRLGYAYVPKYERELPMRRYFVKSPANALRVHLHGLVIGSRSWREHLAFRDALREDAALRAQYQQLKLRLADEFSADKAAYTAAKAPFIQSALMQIRSGGDDE